MVESHVHIRATDGQDGLVRILVPTLRPGVRPCTPKVQRPGHNDITLVILQPGCVYSLPVCGIYNDLRVKLPGSDGKVGCQDAPLSLLTSSAMVGAVHELQPGTIPYCG